MTFTELMDKVLAIFPDAIVDENQVGEVVIATGLWCDIDDELYPIAEED